MSPQCHPQLAGTVEEVGIRPLLPVGEGYQDRYTLTPIPLLLMKVLLGLASLPGVWVPHDVLCPRQHPLR